MEYINNGSGSGAHNCSCDMEFEENLPATFQTCPWGWARSGVLQKMSSHTFKDHARGHLHDTQNKVSQWLRIVILSSKCVTLPHARRDCHYENGW